MIHVEEEILDGQRAFGKTQTLFAGNPVPPAVPNPNIVSWYGTNLVSPLRGAFGYVRTDAGLDNLVGEFVRVRSTKNPEAGVTVYILGSFSNLDTPIVITRRAFLHIEILPLSPTSAYVEIIR